jgi:hypothetical protein
LVKQFPDSRYAACAHEMCTKIAPVAQRQCAAYIERDLRQPAPAAKLESDGSAE